MSWEDLYPHQRGPLKPNMIRVSVGKGANKISRVKLRLGTGILTKLDARKGDKLFVRIGRDENAGKIQLWKHSPGFTIMGNKGGAGILDLKAWENCPESLTATTCQWKEIEKGTIEIYLPDEMT